MQTWFLYLSYTILQYLTGKKSLLNRRHCFDEKIALFTVNSTVFYQIPTFPTVFGRKGTMPPVFPAATLPL